MPLTFLDHSTGWIHDLLLVLNSSYSIYCASWELWCCSTAGGSTGAGVPANHDCGCGHSVLACFGIKLVAS